jgi:hypothetical protein
MKSFLYVILSGLSWLIAVPGYAQKIGTAFNELYFAENFETDEGRWPVLSDAEGLFILQNKEYFIKRHSKRGEEIIKPNYKNNLSSFRLIAAFSIEPKSSERSGMGIIFMMQSDLSGYFLEINSKKEYRIRKLEGVKNYYLSGTEKTEGWVKSSFIKEPGKINYLEVRTEKMVYDIYINNSFVQSFADVSLRQGDFGLVIGPEAAARVSGIYLFTGNKTGSNSEIKSGRENKDFEALLQENNYLKELLNRLTENFNNDTLLIFTEELYRQKSISDSLLKVNYELQQNILKHEKTPWPERSKTVPEKSNN